jgi:hypothetical protein
MDRGHPCPQEAKLKTTLGYFQRQRNVERGWHEVLMHARIPALPAPVVDVATKNVLFWVYDYFTQFTKSLNFCILANAKTIEE